MTELERFHATVRHEEHGEYLFYASFTPGLERRAREYFVIGEGEDIREALGMYNPVMPELRPPEGYIPPDFSGYFDGVEASPIAFINPLGVLEIPGSMYHFTGYVSPLRNAQRFDDLESFPYPSVHRYSGAHMSAEVRSAHGRGRVAGFWIGHMYEDAWQIRGYEEFLMDMIDRPEWCAYILDRIMERNRDTVCADVRAGVDWIKTGDDVANQRSLMFSIGMWRTFMKPRWAEVFSLARDIKPDIQIWYHSDGNIEEIVPELIEIGVTILNPVQPECLEPVSLKRRCGVALVFDGTIGTQTTMPFAEPHEVRRVVDERVRTLGRDGALILSPTHVLEPDVPLENVRAFIEAVEKWG